MLNGILVVVLFLLLECAWFIWFSACLFDVYVFAVCLAVWLWCGCLFACLGQLVGLPVCLFVCLLAYAFVYLSILFYFIISLQRSGCQELLSRRQQLGQSG